jgi:hypothetical protein
MTKQELHWPINHTMLQKMNVDQGWACAMDSDGNVCRWSLDTTRFSSLGIVCRSLVSELGPFSNLDIGAGGRWLIASSKFESLAYRLDVKDVIAVGRTRIGRELTAAERMQLGLAPSREAFVANPSYDTEFDITENE